MFFIRADYFLLRFRGGRTIFIWEQICNCSAKKKSVISLYRHGAEQSKGKEENF